MDALKQYRLKEAGISLVKEALIAEAEKRRGRSFEQWRDAEVRAVWSATRDFAQQHGLRVPTLTEVARVESEAVGHTDYSSKWALYSVELALSATPAAV